MKITLFSTLLLLLPSYVTPLSLPRLDLALRDVHLASTPPAELYEAPDLEKRKGGGGGKGGGSSGGSSGGSGGKTGGSSSSSSPKGSSGSSRSSNVGGTSARGSGAARSYGGGAYYAGGARTPYTAGRRSPSGLSPVLLPVAAVAFFPALWLSGVYGYPYVHPYLYFNPHTHRNESMPVECLCQQYSECGCDDNNNSTFLHSVLNGTVPQNNSVVRLATVNDTEKIFINGTLPNGTTAASGSSAASTARIEELSGYWVMVAAVTGMIYML
ncbi:hypothetical protein DTO166G4_7893 [Paecilomyces variotii]|uniref:Glycine-rich protein n=1 Tax=Byssochlamys spectabilis TaxID=264951 RepID=A0A443HIU7_BYSSP|nr:glycine-rich protein [Paecilomyces variotii]KAJ9210508.1 hypothetical protein DTO166G4_7893 [Paecilomyces variotii]KAJ9230423.1 hypothetical protein DTO166G5_7315 [Paecilomyces variotii]KAJ9232033.1 hypothetical protein DTO169E5_7673 [Paecilomyces variotii]KAJ9247070.1 hypothetical protein DTO207G8_8385 [Paecilomyces variotii]KAJ9290513.1 hypothetical protein DTO021C3_1778 [Paecilomyces variotii]